jgi:aminopeptidase
MTDSRVDAYAHLLVDYCIKVKPGWQVLVLSTPLARPLVEAAVREVARRGAYALVRLNFPSTEVAWAREAPESLLGAMPAIDRFAHEHSDAEIVIRAPENVREEAALSPERKNLVRKAMRPAVARRQAVLVPWISCVYPTAALAQEAGMSLGEYEDFVFAACLLDWPEEGRRMRRIADRFDRADEVRVVSDDTDLRVSLAGRRGRVGEGYGNMPGGEVFYSPIEDSAEGVVAFNDYPAITGGEEVEGIRLAFKDGRVVEASARRGEETLLKTIDTDAGARVLGEIGLGCNPHIQRYTRNVLFDEKMYGTIHLALGSGFPRIGGTNESSLHWDIIKDMRRGGRIFCDLELVQENGAWVF